MQLTDSTRVMRLSRSIPAAAVAALIAACGTTVPPSQLSSGGSASSGGLTAPGDIGLSSAGPQAPAAAPGAATGPGGAVTGPGAVGSTGGGTGAAAASRGAGSAAIHSPISLGILYAVNDGAAPAGIDNGTTITPGRVMRGYVDSWNKSGGIGGRRIEPVYAEMHSYNNNYEQQIAAACAAFTQDHHVAAVLMSLQYYSEQLLDCLGKANVMLVTGDFVAPDRQAAQHYPLFVTPLTQVGEDRESSMVQQFAADRYLSSADRVGVIVEDCPVDNRIYSDGVVPALQRAHVPLGSTFHTQCFQSLQDFGAQTSQMSSAVLQFRQARVNQVMVVSAAAEANIVFAFSEVAENQSYRPKYALTSVAIPVALALNASPNQMANMRGVGWLPVIDSTERSQSPATSTGRSCLGRLKAQGVVPNSNVDVWTAWSPCDAFSLYDAMLRATAGNAAPRTLLLTLPGVMRSYIAASTIGGATGFIGGRPVPTVGQVFAYDQSHGFHYVGKRFGL